MVEVEAEAEAEAEERGAMTGLGVADAARGGVAAALNVIGVPPREPEPEAVGGVEVVGGDGAGDTPAAPLFATTAATAGVTGFGATTTAAPAEGGSAAPPGGVGVAEAAAAEGAALGGGVEEAVGGAASAAAVRDRLLSDTLLGSAEAGRCREDVTGGAESN